MVLERLLTAQMLVFLFFSFVVTNSDTDKVRLRGGETPCSGRVEIWRNGIWGTVCSSLWKQRDANVVCKQLSCGSAVAAVRGAVFGPANGIIWDNHALCEGNEFSFLDCPTRPWGQVGCTHEVDAGVICSGFVKLVAGDGPCNGRVEVNSGTQHSTVCDWNFTLSTAKVICAELECGTAVSIMKSAHFGKGNGPIWDKEFHCNGSEPLLSQCPTVPLPQGKCSHSMDVGIICSRYTDFRLMNGSSNCEGRVEIQVLGTWRTLCDSHWDLADANVLCHQLHCGVALKSPKDAHFGKESDQIIGDTFYCTGIESHLWDCSVTILGTSSCSNGKVASVVCSGNQTQSLLFNNSQSDQEKTPVPFSENGQLRLLNGRGPCSGRVEVFYNGTWGTICDDSWDLRDAHVVCRQLGCGVALEAMVSAHFGQGSGPIWLDELSCSGNESHLGECPSLHWGMHDCRHKEDASVLCSEFLDLRLVSEDRECSGWLEVFYNGTWGSVCSNSMDDSTLSVICRHLSCGAEGHIETLSRPPRNLKARWIDKINCQGKESFLWHCPSQSWDHNSCQQGEEAIITCEGMNVTDCPTSGPCTDKDKLRLRGGETPCSGRVEIWHNGSWGTICDDSWDLADANVVCQQLGCGSALADLEWPAFGPGNGTIWLDDVQCRGMESSLWECPASPWGQNDCKHEEDAGVMCSGFVKLVAGDGPCNGRVEVNSGTQQSTVCDWNFTLSTAKVICAELECGTAVSIMKSAHFGKGNGPIWDEEFHCNGSEPLLSQCPTVPLPQGKCSHSMDVGIICSRYTDFRLMNGSSNCEGRVEIQVLGTWRTLCDSHWDLADSNVLCHQLHCGVALKSPKDAHFGKESDQIIGDTFYCTGIESHLWDCSVTILGTSPCSKGKVASVVCSGNQTQSLPFNNSQSDQEKTPVLFSENGQLRLLNGRGPCSGRVEVFYNGTWGTICDDSWDLRDAHVVCRQLGCGVALEAMVSAHFGQGSGPIWLDELSCSGNESHLGDCPSLHWGMHDCRHKEDASVLCSEYLDLRLVSGERECSGWLEVFYNGTWGSVCSNSMDDNTVSVICRHLSCGADGHIETLSRPPRNVKARWIDKITCQGTESFLWHCPSQSWDQNSCPQGEEAIVTCEGMNVTDCPTSGPCTDKDKLRLRGGETPCSGRVEIWHNGSWGTICDDSWDLADANVVCQQLGCGSALADVEWPAFGPGNGTIWLDDVQCRGMESSLWDCPARPWGQNDCKHEEDAGVMCSGVQTTLPSTTKGPITKTVSTPLNSGTLSLLGIVCLILGALLFLVLIVLGIQIHRGRIQQQVLSRYGDSPYEAVYQEIDYYLTGDKKDLLSSPDISSWPDDPPGDGYDDAEELSGPEIPPVTQKNEGSTLGPTNGWDEHRESNIGQSPEFPAGSPDSRMGEDALPISTEDLGYDDAEFGVPQM
ncbi:antigen WC1.1-like [Notamacropus eugenii]|uniref:antigen WC1.1-like n=1 Tax=Notamacropus eugenii TaxID=9315 RepID=UPI003B6833FA